MGSPSREGFRLTADMVVMGAGSAGIMAAICGARSGMRVVVVDRARTGRGGASVMAPMHIAGAIAQPEPEEGEDEDWQAHWADGIRAGGGLADPVLQEILCQGAPGVIRRLAEWRVGWEMDPDQPGRYARVRTDDHGEARCLRAGVLRTGEELMAGLRRQVAKQEGIRRVSGVVVTRLLVRGGEIRGVLGFDLASGARVEIRAEAVIVASGGLTGLYGRSNAAGGLCGEGWMLAAEAGAGLVDCAFVQFYPVCHVAPQLVGIDPSFWDSYSALLPGRMVVRNAAGEEIREVTREPDFSGESLALEQILSAGTDTVWLDFTQHPEERHRQVFGRFYRSLCEGGVDPAVSSVRVQPVACDSLGGIRVDSAMMSDIPGLFAAGEAVGGAHGAGRLRGNALTAALVFGARAGEAAVLHVQRARKAQAGRAGEPGDPDEFREAHDWQRQVLAGDARRSESPAALLEALQAILDQNLFILRDGARLRQGLEQIGELRARLPDALPLPCAAFFSEAALWFQLRAGCLLGEAMARSALMREESRGCHYRSDFPAPDPAWDGISIHSHFNGEDFTQTRAAIRSLPAASAAATPGSSRPVSPTGCWQPQWQPQDSVPGNP